MVSRPDYHSSAQPEETATASNSERTCTGRPPYNGRTIPKGYRFQSVKEDGTCLYRAIMAANTKNQNWCENYSTEVLLRHHQAKQHLHLPVRKAINDGIEKCNEVYPQTTPQLEDIAKHLNVSMAELGDVIYKQCFANGNFALSNSDSMFSALKVPDTPKMKEALDNLTYIIGAIIATNDDIPVIFPTTTQPKMESLLKIKGVALLWTGNHFELLHADKYFKH